MNTPAGAVARARGAQLSVGGVQAGSLGPVDLVLLAGGYGCLLGPAGAGTSALLRAVAGLVPCSGRINVDGSLLHGTPPGRREFALIDGAGTGFGFGSVAGCLRFAQRARGIPPVRRAQRMAALLAEFDLDGEADPASGDPFQQVRVRLAAALAGEPRLLLLDDPLAGCADRQPAIDLLRATAARHRISVLHATPRREEAFALASHLVLMNGGRVLQAGTAAALYDRPDTLDIAVRLGPANLLPGRIERIEDDVAEVRLECGPLIEADPPRGDAAAGAACRVLLRPERVSVSPLAPAELGEAAVAAVLREVTSMGDTFRLVLALGADAEIVVTRSAAIGARGLVPGRTVSVAWRSQHALTFLA
jgi:ABC-type Fe3+/spermidine/putrescine transport system ATPase subunit